MEYVKVDLKRYLGNCLITTILLLVICIIGLLFSSRVYASEVIESGECGAGEDTVTWLLDDEGTLTISGEGRMQDYNNTDNVPPWYWSRNSITSVVIDAKVNNVGNSAFYDCYYLTSLNIHDGVEEIGESAFARSGLVDVSVPGSVKIIGKQAFNTCNSLESITLSEGVETIDYFAFGSCSSLTELYIPETVISFIGGVSGCTNLKSFSIPNCVTEICDNFFSYCRSLESVEIPDGVTSIGKAAFIYCSSLTHIDIPFGVTTIPEKCFLECRNLKDIGIPESIETVYGDAFKECYALEQISFPDNVVGVGAVNLHQCLSLKKFDIPYGSTIADYGFEGCNSLEKVTIPDSVTTIPNYCFNNCAALNNVVIPDSVKSIGNYAFRSCGGLVQITIPGSVVSISTTAFSGANSLYTCYTVPGSYVSTHKPTSYTRIVYLCDEVEPDNADYLGFITSSIFMTNNSTISIRDYLITGFSINDCRVSLSNNDDFLYDDGVVASLSAGECTITVTCGDYSTSSTIISDETPSSIERISFGEHSINLVKGNSVANKINIYPQNADIQNVNWISSDENIATVEAGKITGVGAGTTIIRASDSNDTTIYDEFEVTVSVPLYNICILNDNIKLEKGNMQRLSLYRYPSDATNIDFNYSSTNTNVVSVDDTGVMIAVNAGSADVIVSSGEISKVAHITVIIPLKGLSLDQSNVRAACGDTIPLTPIFEPTDTTENDIVWSSSKDSVATVDINGLVTVHSKGIATITATAGDYSATCSVVCNTHSWSEGAITMEPTCTETGIKTFTCSCGETYTEEIPATGHKWNEEYTVDKEASCTEEGSKSIHCSVCNAIDEATVEAIPKADHTYGDWKVTKDATCTEDGSKEKVCEVCGDKVTEVIPATGHKWNEEYTVDKEASCTEEGSKSIHCSVCNAIDEPTVEAIPKTDHTYGDWKVTKDATCTEDGSKEKVCEVCGDKVTEVIPATGHKWNEDYTVDKEATCTEEGSKSIHCSVCNAIDEPTVEAIPKTDHTYGDWKVTKDATCTEDGSKEKVCEVCEDKVTEVIPATGHKWNEDYTVDKEATCTEEGSKSIHCSVCNAIDEPTVEAIPKTDHTYGDWTVTKDATCTEDGSKEKVCEVCGDKVTEVIPATGHTEEVLDSVAPTCTETGLTEGKKCSVCGEILVEQETIAALGHDYHAAEGTAVEATCTTAGKNADQKCSRCDSVIEGETIAALGHNWSEWTVVKEATEDEEGLEVRTCGRDAMHTEEKVIPKLDHTHNFVKTAAAAATCTVDGNIGYWTCSKCGRIYSDSEGTVEINKEDTVIPATGHTEEVLDSVAPTCTETGLTEGKKCSVCGEILVEQETIAALGHDYHAAEGTAVEATCTTAGKNADQKCSRCDSVIEGETIAATGHIEEVLVAVSPTCTETGLTEGKKCSVCGEILVIQETVAALGHDYHAIEGTAVEATCTTAGKLADQKCSRCDSMIEGETIAVSGHDWGEWTVVKEATTTEEGLERRTCLRDDSHFEERAIPKKTPEKTGWIKEDGCWYFYENDGTMAVSTWKKDSKGWCYLGSDGRMVTNDWAPDTKGMCWIGSNGYMVEKTQWIQIGSDWYHITKGYRDEGKWMKDSKGWCYLAEDGKMVTNGWAKDSKGWCWIGSAGYMIEKTQWIQYDGGWYHITNGYRDQSKWMKDSQGWCWLQADGRMLTNGWAKDGKGWCWIGSTGYMIEKTQWIKYDGGWYFIEKGYRVQNAWRKDSMGWCYLGPEGRMVTEDFVKDSKGWCWIGPDGYMIEDDMWIGEPGAEGSSYIIKGYRVDNKTIEIDGVEYTFDADGKLVP